MGGVFDLQPDPPNTRTTTAKNNGISFFIFRFLECYVSLCHGQRKRRRGWGLN